MSHVSLHVSLRVLFRLSARLVKLQKLHFLDRYTIPYIKLYTFQKSGMRVQSSWLFLISADWNDSEHLVVRELKFDPRFDFGRAEKKSCSDVFFDGSEFRTASGDTASVVSTDFMKFKILKKFSKISKFSQIISCRQHWLWNHVICQDWWVKSIDFGVNSRKMGKSGKIKYFNWLSTVNRKSHECFEVLEHAQILWYSIRWFFEGWRDLYAHFHRRKGYLKSWDFLKKPFVLEGSTFTLLRYKIRHQFLWCVTFYIISSVRNIWSQIRNFMVKNQVGSEDHTSWGP